MDALRTVGDFLEVWIYFLQIDIVLVRCADSWDIDLTHEDKFNVFAHLRIILFFLSLFQLGPRKLVSVRFFSTECAEITRTISWLCITQKNSNLFQGCLKLEEMKNVNIYMLNAGPVFRWKGAANELLVLLVQHGDK